MRTSTTVLAVLAALALLAPGAHASPLFQASGEYKVGQPLTRNVDACGVSGRSTEGVDSSCARLPEGLAGLAFRLVATDDLMGPVEAEVCFYDGRTYMSCGGMIVPEGANAISVSSIAGYNVRWTFIVE